MNKELSIWKKNPNHPMYFQHSNQHCTCSPLQHQNQAEIPSGLRQHAMSNNMNTTKWRSSEKVQNFIPLNPATEHHLLTFASLDSCNVKDILSHQADWLKQLTRQPSARAQVLPHSTDTTPLGLHGGDSPHHLISYTVRTTIP